MFFESEYITFKKNQNTVTLADESQVLPVTVFENEHKSVKRVVRDLQKDLEKVTGQKPELSNGLLDKPSIIVGTVHNNELLNKLNINIDDLIGKWESFIIQTVTLPDQSSPSIVILGSDNRGAIYGVYDLTEKIGVSPWYWWMDVPVKTHKALYIEEGKISKGEPSVEYRGFFLNDEGPSLMSWVRTHFPDFTHEFYEKIFELTLRLKANYHWPAMWDSTFYEDDEKNIETADLYGVVIGTSHHEPMDRPHGDWKAHKRGAWDYATNKDYLKEFWTEGIKRSNPFETIINLGMRGDGDEPMGGDLTFQEKIKLMETIIADQRQIIQDQVDDVSVEDVPQMWALYKEVKEYYDSGMDIPEDVTLLWGDDNFGNIRRLPTKEERTRKGGAGIYYHFDYVGGPRSYKWVNTVPIQKTYEQMHKAYEYDAKKLWIVNVGDLKPMEFQTEFFLRLAWDIDAFTPDNLETYARKWAAYTFGEEYGDDVAQVIRDYVKFNGRIKPEVINLVELYSWENEYEAERILKEFSETVKLAESVMNRLPYSLRDAFYQVGYYPAKASYTVLKLQLMADLSKLYKKERRVAANFAALEAKRLFEEDKQLTFEYNKRVSDGKWDHMMDQLHIGYTYWQQPDELIMPEVHLLSREDMQDGTFGVKVLNSNTTDRYTRKPLIVEVYNKGGNSIKIEVVNDNDFINVDKSALTLSVQERLTVEVDWEKAPHGKYEIELLVKGETGGTESVSIVIDNPQELLSGGFVPVDGKIAIEAEDYSSKQGVNDHQWTVIPDYGRTKSSMAIYPVEFKKDYKVEESPSLSYDIVLSDASDISVIVVTAPSLPFDPNRGMRLGLSVDDQKPLIVHPGDLSQNGEHDSPDWEKSVIYNCHTYTHNFKELKEGKHSIHISLVDPQVVIQKIIIDCGGLEKSYLGPQPTPHADELENYSIESPSECIDYSFVPGKLDKKAGYVLTSGFYSFSAEQSDAHIEKVDGQTIDPSASIYLSTGFHEFDFSKPESSGRLILEHESLLDLVPRITQGDEGEWVIDLMLHYRGNESVNYKVKAALTTESDEISCGASKGILKTGEQRLINFISKMDLSFDPETLTVEIESEGYTRKINTPIVRSFN